MTNSRKYMLFALTTGPCIFYGLLSIVYARLIDWSEEWQYRLLGIDIALTSFCALALSLYVAGRIVRGAVTPELRILDLFGVHLRIFCGCLIAYFASGLVMSPFVGRWREIGNATEQFWLGRLIEWPISFAFALIPILGGVWLGKMAWDMIREIPRVLAIEAPSAQEPNSIRLTE